MPESRPADVLRDLLGRRIILVSGKGGTGKTTLSAALALRAAGLGKHVLCVDVDVKGDLGRALGTERVGFRPRLVQPGISLLALHPEESLQEYLRIYFRVPGFARLTPLARVFDFVANSIPGTREMLISGKIAYEEKRQERGRPAWDLIIVDAAATGHTLPQLSAARSIMELTRGGLIRSQTTWVAETLADPRRTLLLIAALPQEMAVTEAIELHDRARAESGVAVGACFLNRAFTIPVTPSAVRIVERLAEQRGGALAERMEDGVAPLVTGARLAARLHAETLRHAAALRARLPVPLVQVPIQAQPGSGMLMTRAVADALGGARA